MAASKDLYDKLCTKYQKAVDRLKENEKMNKIVVEAKEKADQKCKQISFHYEKLKDEVERLEEELKIAEVLQKTKTSMTESNQESNSLLSELQCIDLSNSNEGFSMNEPDEDIYFSKSLERRHSYTPNSKVFFKGSQELGIMFYANINIPGKPKETRKDPSEEYFILTTQAVKMNSPHMDTICVIPHAILYEKAVKEEVPFHKWHSWIESQLNFEYIQTLYRKKNRSLNSFKNFIKKF